MQTLLNKTKRENPESPSAAQRSAKIPRYAEPVQTSAEPPAEGVAATPVAEAPAAAEFEE